MSNPTGRNQFSKGGDGGGSRKVKGKVSGPPKMGASAAKFKAAGIVGHLKNTRSRGKAVDTFYGGSKNKLNN